MILIVGATGRLGGHAARQLLEKGHAVRAMTRDPARARDLETAGAEVVQGDLRDTESLRHATRGARAVISSSHSMLGAGRSSSARVDDEGQRALIAASKEAGVAHFVFTSVLGASSDHPVDFWRTKERIERHLESSGLRHTIVRPSAFMEIYAYDLIGKPVTTGKRVMLLGPGTNPRNYVAAADVARLVVLAIEDVRLRGRTVEIGGPENLSAHQVVETFERVTGKKAKVSHVPLPMVRLISGMMGTFHPGVGRILKAAIVGETTDQTFELASLLAEFPIELTPLEDWVRARVGG
ncbi:MAG: SDR family oxidoreductase [Gemmatimonadota bacterium]|nr:SDR family oxidoreductase [Gemmatimonadota bacterium]